MILKSYLNFMNLFLYFVVIRFTALLDSYYQQRRAFEDAQKNKKDQ